MALPSGDDNTVQTIVWRLVAETEAASRNVEQLRENINSLKEEFRKIREVSNASFRQIATDLETRLKDSVKSASKELSDTAKQIKALEKSISKTPPPTSDEAKVALSVKTADLDALKVKFTEIQQRVNLLNSELKIFGQTKDYALKELNQEARNAAVGISTIGSALQATAQVDTGNAQATRFQELTNNAQIAKDKITALETKIAELKTQLESLPATTGQEFSPKVQMEQELTRSEIALQKLREEFSLTQSQLENFTTSTQQTNQALASIGATATQSSQQVATSIQSIMASEMTLGQRLEAIKALMISMQQQTGQSFNLIKIQLKETFAGDVNARINTFKAQITDANAKLKELRATLALRPSGTTQSQFTEMEAEIKRLLALIPQLKGQIAGLQQQQKAANSSIGQAAQQLNASSGATNVFTQALSGLNTISQIVFGFTLAGLATNALRGLASWLQEVAKAGLDFSRAMFQLEVGVRALRRSGIDVTTSDILENLQQINEETGNLFSQLELIQGAAAFANLIRDLGLTREQIFSLQDAVLKLAIVNGRSMEDVQRTVALALSSGYTEGLQRLGVSINRLTIAEEANRIGFEGGYNALSEQARAIATYNLLIQKSTKYGDDLSEAQKRLFGELQGTQAEIENTKAAIGQALLPAQLLWNQAILTTIKLLSIIPFISTVRSLGTMQSVVSALPAVWEAAGKKVESFGERVRIVLDFLSKINKAMRELKPIEPILAEFGGFGQAEVPLGAEDFSANQEKLANILEKYADDITKLDEETAEKRRKIEDDLQDDLSKIQQDGVSDRLEIERDYNADIEKLRRESAQREVELAQELQRKLSEIDIKLNIDLNELKIKFDFDVNETFIKFNEDIAKANEDFRQKELERERKYNEELLRLREDYLMELQDALENRDARAVLRARREFNLNRERARRENEENKIKNKEGLQEDITAAAQRRDARIRELKLELAMRQAELERQAAYDREEAQRRYEQDIIDLREKLRREEYERFIARLEAETKQADAEKAAKIKRLLQYEDEIKDLEQHKKDVLGKIEEILAEQAVLMGLSYEEVKKVIDTYFGEDGEILGTIQTFLDDLKRMIAQFSADMSKIPLKTFKNLESSTGSTTIPKIPQYAEGGAGVATAPTLAQFGEVPELAIFAPLNQLDKLSGLFKNVSKDDGSGNVKIGISLSPGLEAQIIEQSMEKIANVMFEVQRQ